MNRRQVIELVLAALALVGAVWSGLNVRSIVDVAPIIDGERATTSVAYDPPLLVLTLLLTAVGLILAIVAVAGWRRERSA
jgi:hypothetical protein